MTLQKDSTSSAHIDPVEFRDSESESDESDDSNIEPPTRKRNRIASIDIPINTMGGVRSSYVVGETPSAERLRSGETTPQPARRKQVAIINCGAGPQCVKNAKAKKRSASPAKVVPKKIVK